MIVRFLKMKIGQIALANTPTPFHAILMQSRSDKDHCGVSF
jgi:hypothetical protein